MINLDMFILRLNIDVKIKYWWNYPISNKIINSNKTSRITIIYIYLNFVEKIIEIENNIIRFYNTRVYIYSSLIIN